MPKLKLHNVGFYKPEPKAIYSMALEKTQDKLALSRSDASIEIWNLTHTPFIERTIPSSLENFSIEGLVWSGKRLFSVGLHGWLVEYDLFSLSVKNKWSITGEAGTCLDCNKSLIAVGSEQGYINIYELTEDGVDFQKFLDKQEGRIISLKFSPTGEFVVAGSINAIRIWNVRSGHAIHKMILGRSEAKKDTVVWCLEVMSDFTIFSGDSRGILTLWDGKMGAQIETYQSHKADITALCLDENEESVYAAGIDPLIANYQKVKVGPNIKWVKSIQRKIHDHDVRSMIFHKGRLYSAGIDSYLVCSYHPPKTLIKYAPITQEPCVQVASGGGKILLRYSKHIEVWALGSSRDVDDNHKGAIELTAKPKKLLAIQKVGKNWAEEDEAEGVACACISSDGRWIFLGTATGYRLYKSSMENGTPQLSKIEDLDDNNVPCIRATFNDKRRQLIVALGSGCLVIYELDDGSPFINQRIEQKEARLTDTVAILTVSKCGNRLIAADNDSNISVFDYTKDGYSFRLRLPRCAAPPTAIAVNPKAPCLVVAYSDNKLHEYNLKLGKFTNFSRNLEAQSAWKPQTHPIRSIAFDSRNDGAVFVHDDSNIIVISKHKGPTKSNTSKVAKTNGTLTNGDVEEFRVKTIQKCKHLIHLAALSEGEMLTVEVNPLSILESLPPAFAQKTFGTK